MKEAAEKALQLVFAVRLLTNWCMNKVFHFKQLSGLKSELVTYAPCLGPSFPFVDDRMVGSFFFYLRNKIGQLELT